MATATSRKAQPDKKVLAKRRTLCEERLAIDKRLAPDYSRIAAIEAELKQLATDGGESFREQFGADYVSASGAVAAEFKGNVPMVQTEAWNVLRPAERKAHEKSGLIKIDPQWGRASNGRVTVKVY